MSGYSYYFRLQPGDDKSEQIVKVPLSFIWETLNLLLPYSYSNFIKMRQFCIFKKYDSPVINFFTLNLTWAQLSINHEHDSCTQTPSNSSQGNTQLWKTPSSHPDENKCPVIRLPCHLFPWWTRSCLPWLCWRWPHNTSQCLLSRPASSLLCHPKTGEWNESWE